MNYNDALSYIHSLLKFGIKPGFERINALLSAIGDPQEELKVIHVAGTNGKGSTCTMVASALSSAGYKTGLFTSPYVVDFCERIQVDSEYIPHGDLARLTEELKPIADKNEEAGFGPTEFEFITALAFLYFKNVGCDYVVLETGLGGRLDSTNVVKNPLCVGITNIALDHTAILGDSIEAITAEKCGIIKSGIPVVCAVQRFKKAEEIIFASALNIDCDVTLCRMENAEIISRDFTGSRFVYDGEEYFIRLVGDHQIANAITAIELLRSSGIELTTDDIKRGLGNAFIPSRLEVLSNSPVVILDGAHNPDGAAALVSALEAFGEKFTAIVGMMSDKNYDSAVKILSSVISSSVAVEVSSNPRTLSKEQMCACLKKYIDDVELAKDYESALKLAAEKSSGKPILICGSFYLAGDIRPLAIDYFKNSH